MFVIVCVLGHISTLYVSKWCFVIFDVNTFFFRPYQPASISLAWQTQLAFKGQGAEWCRDLSKSYSATSTSGRERSHINVHLVSRAANNKTSPSLSGHHLLRRKLWELHFKLNLSRWEAAGSDRQINNQLHCSKCLIKTFITSNRPLNYYHCRDICWWSLYCLLAGWRDAHNEFVFFYLFVCGFVMLHQRKDAYSPCCHSATHYG